MLNQRLEAAKTIYETLISAEVAVDDALAKACELGRAMPAARLSANLALCVGQPAVDEAVAALNALALARRHLVATHEALAEAKDMIGLRPVAFGSGFIKPPSGLHVAGEAARAA